MWSTPQFEPFEGKRTVGTIAVLWTRSVDEVSAIDVFKHVGSVNLGIADSVEQFMVEAVVALAKAQGDASADSPISAALDQLVASLNNSDVVASVLSKAGIDLAVAAAPAEIPQTKVGGVKQ